MRVAAWRPQRVQKIKEADWGERARQGGKESNSWHVARVLSKETLIKKITNVAKKKKKRTHIEQMRDLPVFLRGRYGR